MHTSSITLLAASIAPRALATLEAELPAAVSHPHSILMEGQCRSGSIRPPHTATCRCWVLNKPCMKRVESRPDG